MFGTGIKYSMSGKGFTLIELVLVLVLLGIVSSYAVLRFPQQHELLLHRQAELLISHIQLSQKLATNWHEPLRMTFSGSSYTVACAAVSTSAVCSTNPVLDPTTGLSFAISLQTGSSISGASSIDFDTLGRPVASGQLMTTAVQVSLIMGNGRETVRIQPITGFAEII